jgi:hypothetical protein
MRRQEVTRLRVQISLKRSAKKTRLCRGINRSSMTSAFLASKPQFEVVQRSTKRGVSQPNQGVKSHST